MIRRFNYTDRRKVPRENLRVAWVEGGGGPLQFQAALDLALEKPLDPAALVFVEAYSGPVVMRFPFGTVEHPEHPADPALGEFPPGLRPHFRVKVVDPGPDRRLLAWADGITPQAPDEAKAGRRSILPVETVDLGALVWKLRFEGNEVRLQLNSAIRQPRDITVLAREPDFIALVYPAVIRQILEHLLLGPLHDSVDPGHDWLVFGAVLAAEPPPDRDDQKYADGDDAFAEDVNEWVEKAILGFCEQRHAAEAFVRFKESEEPSHV